MKKQAKAQSGKKPNKGKGISGYGITRDQFHALIKKASQPVKEPKLENKEKLKSDAV